MDPTPATFTWAIIPDTVIESAVDGNGDDLIAEIDPSTTSDTMTLTFFAELDGEPTIVDGFLCALDGEVVDCSIGSITYEDLPLGTHTFQVVAFTDDTLIVRSYTCNFYLDNSRGT